MIAAVLPAGLAFQIFEHHFPNLFCLFVIKTTSTALAKALNNTSSKPQLHTLLRALAELSHAHTMSSHLPILLPLATTRPNHSEYILSITPHQQQQQLVLTHPGPDISLVDAQSLKPLQVLRGGHVPGTTVSCVATAASTALDISTPGSSSASGVGDGGSSTIWSAGKDARVVRWDTRSAGNGNGGPEVTIKGEFVAWADDDDDISQMGLERSGNGGCCNLGPFSTSTDLQILAPKDGKDARVRTSSFGDDVCEFSLAVRRRATVAAKSP